SASTLLRSSLFDPEDVVRHTAFDVYSRHPMRKKLTKEQENMILEKKYTYPIVSRIRKRSADKLLEENDFDVNLSQYNWGKNQGSGNIGSSSGLDSDQSVKFHMTQVESVVTLKADKQSHSKANAGFVHKRFDNHRTKICDKKSFHYDLNVLNDYGFNDAQDVMTEYDKIQQQITGPIRDAIKGINRLIFGTTSENKLLKSIDSLSRALANCYHSILLVDNNFTKELYDIAQFNVISDIKPAVKLLQEVGSFIKDIKDDLNQFYFVSYLPRKQIQ
ncbi:uncharacterized protein LOC134259687, partial [Saccostrea cucullata]|uniref:uncharacterized protein LOC134259687 n=1 Tax=Saccostrea cuccullata TaxID=36930 RepID=UPI002ED3627E